MFAYRHDILKAMIADGARLVVLGREREAERPAGVQGREEQGRASTRCATSTTRRTLKLMVVPEENVLGLPGEPFAGECMVVSVFAKGLLPGDRARGRSIPEFDKRRGKQQYELRVKRLDVEFDKQAARSCTTTRSAKGLWKGTPAARDRVEYWAAGVEAYFDAAGAGLPPQRRRPARSPPARRSRPTTRTCTPWSTRRWRTRDVSIGDSSRGP